MRLQIKDIIPNPANPRVIRDEQFRKLKQSLAQFPQMLEKRPIAVTKEGGKYIALGGNQRLRALLDLEKEIDEKWFQQTYYITIIEEQILGNYFAAGIPVVDCTELTPMQQKRFIIADNVPFGEWDWEGLANEWDVEELADWGLNVPGWEQAEDESEKASDEELDESTEDAEEIQTDIKLGDLFEIGPHRLLCGDSTSEADVSKLMNGRKADMVFTDPPYNVSFNGRSGKFDVIKNDNLTESEFEKFINGFVSVLDYLRPENYYIWCNWKFYGILQSKLDFKACIVWAKNVFGLGRGYRHQHEFCLFYGKIDDGINNESDLWEVKKDTQYVHPTQKPIGLAMRAFNNHKESKLIIDLFLGSGSTMVAAQQCGRTCYGLELDPKYCQVIVNRMQKLYPNLQITKNGQPYATTNTTTKGE